MIHIEDFCNLLGSYQRRFNLELLDEEFYYHKVVFSKPTQCESMYTDLWSYLDELWIIHFWHNCSLSFNFKWFFTKEDYYSIINDHHIYNDDKEIITALMERYDKNYFGDKYNLI
jgi:hypothetical protein